MFISLLLINVIIFINETADLLKLIDFAVSEFI